MNKLFADFFETGLKDIKFKFSDLETELPKGPIQVKLYPSGEGPQTIRASVTERMPTIETAHPYIEYGIEPEYALNELPKGSLDEFKTKFDSHIKKLKSIKFQIPTQLKEIYLDLVAKLENVLNYVKDIAVGLFAEFVEYINIFIEWLTGPTKKTAEEILIEIKDVKETVELMEDYVKK